MINVFICTYNPNPQFLRETIESIQKQDLPRDLWNLTVIDNNSTSPVAKLAVIKELKVKTVVEKTQGLTAARKCATLMANGDLLVFIDDDNILEPNYLSTAKQLFTQQHIGILSGHIAPRYEIQPAAWFKPFEPMLAIRLFEADQDVMLNESSHYNSRFPVGAGMIVRKELISEYYNEHLSADNYIEGRKGDDLTSSEDIDLDLYALSKGYKIGVSPKLRMLHIIPPRRIEADYIIKMAEGNLKSGMTVNKKWNPVFKHNIFNLFDVAYPKIFAALTIYGLLSFRPAFRIKYAIFKQIFNYKTKYRESAGF